MGKRLKKILVIGEAFYPEDFLINDLVMEWEHDCRDVEVLTRAPSYPFGRVYQGYKNRIYQKTYFNSIKVHRFPVMQGYAGSAIIKVLNYFSFVFWSCWVVLFIGRRFDRVFIYQTGPLTLAVAGIFLKKLYGATVSIWTQDLWPDTVYAYGFKKTKILSFCLDRFVKWVYKSCDHIFVSCKGFTERIHSYVPQAKIDFAPNWPLIVYNPGSEKILPGNFNFTFAGNIGKVQNLENVVRGFALFVKNYSSAGLNIIGDGSYLSELKRITEEENIPNVYFHGRKPLAEMSDYYKASDVLIISLTDAPIYSIMIPSKFQTYLVTSKPIYAVMNGEVRDIVEHNRIGVGASPSDLNEIADGFRFFMEIPEEELQIIKANSSRLLETVFSRQSIISHINSVVWDD